MAYIIFAYWIFGGIISIVELILKHQGKQKDKRIIFYFFQWVHYQNKHFTHNVLFTLFWLMTYIIFKMSIAQINNFHCWVDFETSRLPERQLNYDRLVYYDFNIHTVSVFSISPLLHNLMSYFWAINFNTEHYMFYLYLHNF